MQIPEKLTVWRILGEDKVHFFHPKNLCIVHIFFFLRKLFVSGEAIGGANNFGNLDGPQIQRQHFYRNDILIHPGNKSHYPIVPFFLFLEIISILFKITERIQTSLKNFSKLIWH